MGRAFLGVDVAGAEKTWMCALREVDNGLKLENAPGSASLVEIVRYAEHENIDGVAIDAQLTHALSEETGMRSSDMQLRGMLPANCRNWVQSQNSLQTVTVRGRQLAEALSPIVGTIIETHPRACLNFVVPEDLRDTVNLYKQNDENGHGLRLWEYWCKQFGISGNVSYATDHGLDALVCATVAWMFHHNYDMLLRLQQESVDKRGRGPFYVIRPSRL